MTMCKINNLKNVSCLQNTSLIAGVYDIQVKSYRLRNDQVNLIFRLS